MAEEVVIKVDRVSKDFRFSASRANSLKNVFTGIFRSTKSEQNTQHALKNISFEVKKGEFFGIVGRNGSGKSTMLKMLAGIYQPNKGKINVTGKLVPFIELGVGFNPELTGRENVYMNGALLNFSEKEVDRFYDEVVRFAELEKFMDQKLKNYSSGMQVRLAFSMAIRAKADILLIDEVLAVGDADFQRKCFEYFQRLKSEDVTVVFVTHDMGAVRQYCDRAILIDNSEIIDIGEPEAIAKQYTRLFSETNSDSHSINKMSRWGNQKAKYSNVAATIVDEGRNILISANVHSTENIADPTYGFMISNEAKQPILGTNSNIEQVKQAPLREDENVLIEWKVPNIFNEGLLHVELVLMYKSVTEVADWWENAGSFHVKNPKRTPYLVNPNTQFMLRQYHD